VRIGLIAALEKEAAACNLADLGHDVIVRVCGIGKVNAAVAATRLLIEDRCELLLVVGTAGGLAGCPSGCFWVASAVQHDYGARRSTGFAHYSAGAWPIGPASVTAHAATDDPGVGLPHVRIASGDAFIECPDHADDLVRALDAQIVDMETAAVAQVAAAFNIPWAAIKAVSDGANGESGHDFQANLTRAARAAGEGAARFVALLGPDRTA